MLELIERLAADGEVADSVSLPYDLRQKCRQRVRLDSGRDAAIVLPPGTPLLSGERLRAADGTTVRINAASEAVTIGRTDDPVLLARACYHLGNRHVALQVGRGWVRYQPDHVLDDMVRGLGLAVSYESAPFDPERGAYDVNSRHRHHQGEGASHGHRN